MINILDMSEVERIINEITSSENLERKRKEYINYEIESGLLNKYVAAKVKQLYPETHALYTIAEYSLLHKVVSKKAKAYKEPPVRKLEKEDESNVYTEFLKKNRFNDAMKEVDRIFNQHRCAGLYVALNEADEKVCFYPLRPYEFDVVKNDEGEVVCLILSYPGSQITKGAQDSVIAGDKASENINEVEYIFWTKEHHRAVIVQSDSGGKKKVSEKINEGNPSNVNPYGIIPFAFLPYDFNENYPNPSPLPNQTVELNASISIYLSNANMQFGQLVISGPADQKTEKATSGMMTGLYLPQSKNPEDKPTTAQYIAPSPDLAGQKEAIITYMSMVLDQQGIGSTQKLGASENFTSGLDRMLSESDVQSIIEDNQDFYVRFEQQVYEIANKMIGDEFNSKFLQIVFKKPKMLSSDTEKLANLEKMLELGLLEEWQKFIEVDPNMTEDQAKEKLTRINEYKSSALSAALNINPIRELQEQNE